MVSPGLVRQLDEILVMDFYSIWWQQENNAGRTVGAGFHRDAVLLYLSLCCWHPTAACPDRSAGAVVVLCPHPHVPLVSWCIQWRKPRQASPRALVLARLPWTRCTLSRPGTASPIGHPGCHRHRASLKGDHWIWVGHKISLTATKSSCGHCLSLQDQRLTKPVRCVTDLWELGNSSPVKILMTIWKNWVRNILGLVLVFFC